MITINVTIITIIISLIRIAIIMFVLLPFSIINGGVHKARRSIHGKFFGLDDDLSNRFRGLGVKIWKSQERVELLLVLTCLR